MHEKEKEKKSREKGDTIGTREGLSFRIRRDAFREENPRRESSAREKGPKGTHQCLLPDVL